MAYQRHGSSRDLVQLHEADLESLLRQGKFKPVLLYQVVLFNLLPLLGLIIPRHRGGIYIRRSIFALSLGVAAQIFKNHRGLLGGNGYMFGLITAWWLVWNAGLLVFTDIEDGFQRIERGAATSDKSGSAKVELSNATGHPQTSSPDSKKQEPRDRFHWQSYPQKLSHRLEWCAGLLFNLRGPEWNWRAPHLGPLPRSVHSQLRGGFISDKFQSVDDNRYPSSKARLRDAFRTCLVHYMLLDCLKAIMMRDPYFRGTSTVASPPFPLPYFEAFPILIRFYHIFISCMGVYVALSFVTSFNPICFLGLSLAFPNASRKLTAAPLDASWLYADSFGSFFESILDHGLAGCWGRWWHQIFRNGFTTTAQWILSFLPTKLAHNASFKRMVHIVVAFSLSGFIHACGSYTQFTETHPLSGPFLFFNMQSLAVIGEYIFKTVVFPRLPFSQTPRYLRRTGNAVFTFSWVLFSGARMADDFARGGLWLVEPIPLSPLRGLGIANGSGWWCWEGAWFRYWNDGTYWGSGIRVV
ncbi:uncharacterized protein N7469_002930 [Penicillium citrinum]|uniref:Wax synthase domain-containing protein n=1 Tax=Penicillium citrinum TaxID=5077 RepID=A0A9W9PB89_PENCI|nr:uncharacterized protein N7469_002930 [Penicillium citrinum]KAJ5241339.1 hypothetical protein N7469_002930 [Penicillium citrinum]KAK5789288.1 hypothetical protein VI817_008412 [Penicillium citrinum]